MSPQLAERIEQFRKMTVDDPDNELGHFRLGQLLQEGGEHAEAISSFRKTLMLSPQFSKVYQLLAKSELELGKREDAIRTLNEGCRIADARGDRMPREEMTKMLAELGEKPPEAPKKAAGTGTGFPCQRPGCLAGDAAVQLAKPPIPDETGDRIFRTICADCWQDWLKNYSIKVINELRLDLSLEAGQAEYDKYMRGFFGFEEAPAAEDK
ncbi:MAG: Fe(2+)-trafficking protein [Gemmataceae bacterium]